MIRIAGSLLLVFLLAGVNLLPLALILKQAFTPESESFAWPPTWVPERLTLENFRVAAGAIELASGLGLSLEVALATVVSTLARTVPAAWAAARLPRLRRPLEGAVVVARLFPSLALAVPLAVLFLRAGLYDHPAGLGLWLAHTLLAAPVAFLILRGGFAAVPEELEEAARLDGATGLLAFWHVTLPVVRPALGAATLLVFLVSWDEFAYALMLQVTHRPLPALLYYLAAFGHPGLASAVSALMLVPALCVVVVLEPALRPGVLAGSGR
jgi:ABC-type glycerol-3-phosphate transport system permease component